MDLEQASPQAKKEPISHSGVHTRAKDSSFLEEAQTELSPVPLPTLRSEGVAGFVEESKLDPMADGVLPVNVLAGIDESDELRMEPYELVPGYNDSGPLPEKSQVLGELKKNIEADARFVQEREPKSDSAILFATPRFVQDSKTDTEYEPDDNKKKINL